VRTLTLRIVLGSGWWLVSLLAGVVVHAQEQIVDRGFAMADRSC
jgi:hypothetical protein